MIAGIETKGQLRFALANVTARRKPELQKQMARYLMNHMDDCANLRWLISACDTFTDAELDSLNPDFAFALAVFANQFKFYTFDMVGRGKDVFNQDLGSGLQPFMHSGDTLVNQLLRLRQLAERHGKIECKALELAEQFLQDVPFYQTHVSNKLHKPT